MYNISGMAKLVISIVIVVWILAITVMFSSKPPDSASTWVDVSDRVPSGATGVSYSVETEEGVECDFAPSDIYTIKITCKRSY